MFGRKQYQVVNLSDLADFLKQIMPQQQPGGNVTIYIGELHIHQPGSTPQVLPNPGRMALSAPDVVFPDPYSTILPDHRSDGGEKFVDGVDRALNDLVPRYRR